MSHVMCGMSMPMWVVMMVGMMLPALVLMLRHYRQPAIVAIGYVFVWIVIGAAMFPLEPVLARAVPLAVGVVVLIAGALQFTGWKARQLACCRAEPAPGRTAWQHGLRLGLRCAFCCGNLMVIGLVLGMMDLRVMAAVTAAITAERFVPAVARALGAVVVAAGLVLIARGL